MLIVLIIWSHLIFLRKIGAKRHWVFQFFSSSVIYFPLPMNAIFVGFFCLMKLCIMSVVWFCSPFSSLLPHQSSFCLCHAQKSTALHVGCVSFSSFFFLSFFCFVSFVKANYDFFCSLMESSSWLIVSNSQSITKKGYIVPAWTRSCAACCRQPCFGRGLGLDDPQRSLPTPTILWFCDINSYFSELSFTCHYVTGCS